MKKQLTLALDPGLLDALRAQAHREHRSVSNLIEFWMQEAVTPQPPDTAIPARQHPLHPHPDRQHTTATPALA